MTIQEQIEKIERELAELKAECSKEYKIEYSPKDSYIVYASYIEYNDNYASKEFMEHGRFRRSEEEAKRAFDTQTRMMRLGALIENCGGSKEFVEGEENYYLYYNYEDKKFDYTYTIAVSSPERIYAARDVAKKAVDTLNSGRYKLEV
jgi:hypothetical protein